MFGGGLILIRSFYTSAAARDAFFCEQNDNLRSEHQNVVSVRTNWRNVALHDVDSDDSFMESHRLTKL